jgi:hypothetical protein
MLSIDKYIVLINFKHHNRLKETGIDLFGIKSRIQTDVKSKSDVESKF